ncbi:MAG: proton-conducting transporter membrane subunit [Bacillota bacterium]|nr:proton-conducting transporter membrane subunit [Bacillota bacterium]
MTSPVSHLGVLVVIVPLLAAYCAELPWQAWRRASLRLATVTAAAVFGFCVLLAAQVMQKGALLYAIGGRPAPWGIEFLIDPVAAYLLLGLSGIFFLVALFAEDELEAEIGEAGLPHFSALYLLLEAALLGLVATNDLFNTFVFLEISAIAAVGLVALKNDRLSIEAAYRYLILSTLGSGAFLFAIALLYAVTGHLNLEYLKQALAPALASYPLSVAAALAMLLLGLMVKAALYPLHIWLPDAHAAAPTPSSAILSGVVVEAYALVLLKLVLHLFPAPVAASSAWRLPVLWASTAAIFAGSLAAIREDDIKKMLAYSTVSQVGYLLLGVGLLSRSGLLGSLLHVLNHAVVKAMLFLAAGAIIRSTGRRRVSEWQGVGLQAPLPAAAFAVGALSMVGIPPLNGFISKWYLSLGALEARMPLYLWVVLLSSLLNAAYYIPVVVRCFLTPARAGLKAPSRPASATAPLLVLALATLLMGLFPSVQLGLVGRTVAAWAAR